MNHAGFKSSKKTLLTIIFGLYESIFTFTYYSAYKH